MSNSKTQSHGAAKFAPTPGPYFAFRTPPTKIMPQLVRVMNMDTVTVIARAVDRESEIMLPLAMMFLPDDGSLCPTCLVAEMADNARLFESVPEMVKANASQEQRLREWDAAYQRHITDGMEAERERQDELQRARDEREEALEMIEVLVKRLGDAHVSDPSATHYGDEVCTVCEDVEAARGLLEGKSHYPRVWTPVERITPVLNRRFESGGVEFFTSRPVLIRFVDPTSEGAYSVAVAYLDGDGTWTDQQNGNPYGDVVEWMDIPRGGTN